MRTWRMRRVAAVVAAVAVVCGGAYRWWYGHTHQSTDDAQISGHVIPVLSRVGGYVLRVHVADDAVVQAGDTLLTLDARDLAARRDQARATWRAAVAAGPAGAAGEARDVTRAQLAALEAGVRGAAADSQHAAEELSRIARLADADIAPRQQLDAARTALRVAVAAVQAARSQVVGARASLVHAEADMRAASSQVAALRAALDEAELQLSYASVLAPAGGRIASRTVEAGQLVAAGQGVMAIVRRDSMWVVANLQEIQLQRVHPGLLACIGVDAFPDHALRGHVVSIQQATGATFSLFPPDNATGSFTKVVQRVPVRIALDRASLGRRELSPGLSASVVIDTRRERANARCDDQRRARAERP